MGSALMEWEIAGVLFYLMIIPLMYGYLDRREYNRKYNRDNGDDMWYDIVWSQWACFWPLVLLWLIVLGYGRFLYSVGRNWS